MFANILLSIINTPYTEEYITTSATERPLMTERV